MDALEKWMIIRITPYQLDVLAKTFVPIILAAKWLCSIQVRPLTNSNDLCFLFCLNPSSMSSQQSWSPATTVGTT